MKRTMSPLHPTPDLSVKKAKGLMAILTPILIRLVRWPKQRSAAADPLAGSSPESHTPGSRQSSDTLWQANCSTCSSSHRHHCTSCTTNHARAHDNQDPQVSPCGPAQQQAVTDHNGSRRHVQSIRIAADHASYMHHACTYIHVYTGHAVPRARDRHAWSEISDIYMDKIILKFTTKNYNPTTEGTNSKSRI